jgi:glycosyltransferase involved in cell wall biosynthesis
MNPRTATVSVIIPNYNYALYVGQAIDSALKLEWPCVEVIVVDDGSTDRSREVIASYGDRIKTILQVNGGQRIACNSGYAMSRGEIVIFLDSDDLLHPSLARELAAVWTPTTSKVQVQMQVIDGRGRPTGAYFPQFHIVPTPQQAREWSARTTAYPTPPGSGNAYSRKFLDKIYPLVDLPDRANDSYCLAAAPFLGDVITIAKPLASYRVHDRNQSTLVSRLDIERFETEMSRAVQRTAYARSIARSVGIPMTERAIDLNLSFLAYRLASLKLAPWKHPRPGDSVPRVLADVARAFFAPQGVSLPGRIAMLCWAAAVGFLPATLARGPVLWRFAPSSRPRLLRKALTALHVVRGARDVKGPAGSA